MNHCARNGYLVDANGVIPEDPTDLGVELLPAVGCSNLVCDHCKESVRNQVAGEAREYRCSCSSWEETSKHPLYDPDPDPGTDPTMPWKCAGHPAIDLPCMVDGVDLRSDAAVRDAARSVLREAWHPPGARAADEVRASWLRRLYVRLAKPAPLVETAVACLTDPAIDTRGRVLAFFKTATDPSGLAQLVPHLGDRALFAGIADPISSIQSETLEDSLWRVVAPLIGSDLDLRKLARRVATTPGRGSRAIYDVLATHDPDWFVANVEGLARANRDRVDDLVASYAAFRSGATIKSGRERALAAAKDPIPRARTTAEMQFAASLQPCPKCSAPTSGLTISSGPEAWVYSGKCPSCGTVRSFQFTIEGNPRTNPYERLELGDGRPSAVIDPQLFVAELERIAPSLRDDPSGLSGAEWTRHKEAAERAYTCAVELAKFLPPGGGNVAGIAHDRAWVEGERDRAVSRLDRVILDAPRIWSETSGRPLDAVDELRALIIQGGTRKRPSVEQLAAYLASRPKGALEVRLWKDANGVHAEVDVSAFTSDDLQEALLGATLPVDVDPSGKHATIHFGRGALNLTSSVP